MAIKTYRLSEIQAVTGLSFRKLHYVRERDGLGLTLAHPGSGNHIQYSEDLALRLIVATWLICTGFRLDWVRSFIKLHWTTSREMRFEDPSGVVSVRVDVPKLKRMLKGEEKPGWANH